MQPFIANAAAGQYVESLISIEPMMFAGVLLNGVWIALSHFGFPLGRSDWHWIQPGWAPNPGRSAKAHVRASEKATSDG